MGLFRRKPAVDPAQLAAVTAELADVRAQLEALGKRLDADDAARRVAAANVAGLQQRVAAVGVELTNQLTELSGEIDALQQRPDPTPMVAAVGELGGAVDALRAETAGNSAAIAEVRATAEATTSEVDVLRTTQERLANEQARYQIAFRDDLATLADQVTRKRA